MNSKQKIAAIRRMLVLPALFLVALMAYGLFSLLVRDPHAMGETAILILVGCVVASAALVLFVYTKISDHLERTAVQRRRDKDYDRYYWG